jgi:hypothetical protein
MRSIEHPFDARRAQQTLVKGRQNHMTLPASVCSELPGSVSVVGLSAPMALGRLRLTRRGRMFLLLAMVLAAFVAFSTMRIATQAGTTYTGSATHTVTVRPGETLWQIARRVAPQDDPRDTIHRLRDLNALDATVLQAGQRLIVPS